VAESACYLDPAVVGWFSEFSGSDADRLRELPDEALDELTDAIAMRRTWAEIEPILRQRG
jgi:hypothetical protein